MCQRHFQEKLKLEIRKKAERVPDIDITDTKHTYCYKSKFSKFTWPKPKTQEKKNLTLEIPKIIKKPKSDNSKLKTRIGVLGLEIQGPFMAGQKNKKKNEKKLPKTLSGFCF